jgi:hypothetical protein
VSLDYIRSYYAAPAKRRGRVRFTGCSPAQDGTILGAKGQYLSVRFDDGRKGILHPTWEVEYLDAAEVTR